MNTGNEFDNVPVHTSESLADQEKAALAKREARVTTMAPIAHSAEQSRQIAEVQAMMTVAKGDPRDDVVVWTRMRRVCQRYGFAQRAKYAFPRGNKMVAGLGIKAIRELATIYGNLDYGYRVMDLEDDISWVEAFAWDLEKNVRVVRKFPVKHWRDKTGGGEAVESERDKYEIVAGITQRRVRSCLEQLLPADYLDEAETLIDKTLKDGDGRPMADRLRDMQVLFLEVGVTDEQLEAYLQHPIKAIVPAQLPRLQQIYTSIRDGIMKVSEAFPPVTAKRVVPPPKDTPPEKPKKAAETAKTKKAGKGKAKADKPGSKPAAEVEVQDTIEVEGSGENLDIDQSSDGNLSIGGPGPQDNLEPGKDVDGDDDPFALE